MTITTIETAVQAAEPPNDSARREDLQDILDQARDAVQQIEVGVDEINGVMVDLIILAADLPNSDDVRALADNLGAEANELFEALDRHFAELRREVAADAGEEGEDS
jgi:hypothetical protein